MYTFSLYFSTMRTWAAPTRIIYTLSLLYPSFIWHSSTADVLPFLSSIKLIMVQYKVIIIFQVRAFQEMWHFASSWYKTWIKWLEKLSYILCISSEFFIHLFILAVILFDFQFILSYKFQISWLVHRREQM